MSDQLTPEIIAEGLRLDALRQAGPWMVEYFSQSCCGIHEVTSPSNAPASERYSVFEDPSEDTCLFAAHAANHYGAALRQLQAQAAELERLRALATRLAEHVEHNASCPFDGVAACNCGLGQLLAEAHAAGVIP